MKRQLFYIAIIILLFQSTPGAQPTINEDSIAMYLSLEDVVVTAQYVPTDSRRSIHVIRSIDREVIEQRGAITLDQLLDQELNIRISQDLILGSSLSLQGVSGQNVKIMIDGVPLIGRVGDDIDLSQVNLGNIERVELAEGPMSVHYGTNALGGVINLISRKSQLHRYDIGLNSQWESAGRRNLNARLGARLTDQLLLQLSGGLNTFTGFNAVEPEEETARRTFQWNPKDQWFANGMLRYNLGDDRHLRYSLSWFDEKISNLGAVRRPQFKPYAFDDYYYTRRLDQSLHYEGSFAKDLYWHLTAGYNSFRRRKNTLRFDLEEGVTGKVPGQQDTTEYRALMFRPVLASRFADGRLNFQAGLDINYENGRGRRFADPEAGQARYSEIADFAAFATLRYAPLETLHLEFGARAAYNTRFDAPVVPSLHLRYDWNDRWQLRASYARGFRSPSIKELFFYFVDASHYIIGNPDLQAEVSDNLQLSLNVEHRWGDRQLKASVTGFYNDIRQKIQLFDFVEQNGTILPAAALDTLTTQFAYFNQDRFRVLGGNLRLNYTWKNLEAGFGLAPTGRYNPLSKTEAIEEYTWAVEMNGQLSYHFADLGMKAALFLRHNDRLLRYYQALDKEGNTVARQSVLDGFTLADFTLRQSLWKDRLQLSGGVKNLFDVRNVLFSGNAGGAHSGNDGVSPVAMGRNYFLRLEWRLTRG